MIDLDLETQHEPMGGEGHFPSAQFLSKRTIEKQAAHSLAGPSPAENC